MTSKLQRFFDSSLVATRVTSADVKIPEAALGYLVGPFLAFISNAIFGSYLNRYYSDVLGWTDVQRFGVFSGLLPMVSVVFVIIGNLWVGRLIDNTRTSQGKARPYLLLSAPLLLVAIVFLLSDPYQASPVVQMVWIALSYNIYYSVAYPLFYASHSSFVALSTRDSKQRGLLGTFSNASMVAAVGVGASILVPVLLQSWLFVETDGSIDTIASYDHWRILMVALCVVTVIGILIEYYFTRERITEENLKLGIVEEKVPLGKQIASCVSEPYWWLIILYFVFFQFSGMLKNGSMSYYSRWMFDGVTDEASAGTVMSLLGLIGGVPTAVGMLVAWPIASKLGKRNAIVAGLAISVLGGSVSFLDVHNLTIVCAGVVLKGIGSIPAMYVTLALMSDVLDHLEAKNGFRSDGFTMSVYGSIMVGMTGLGNGIINALLVAGGYDASLAEQSGVVQAVLTGTYLGGEIVCYAIIAVLMLFLGVEKHVKADQEKIIAAQKAAVEAAGGEWVSPEERLRMEESMA